jgi:hypothetical protein
MRARIHFVSHKARLHSNSLALDTSSHTYPDAFCLPLLNPLLHADPLASDSFLKACILPFCSFPFEVRLNPDSLAPAPADTCVFTNGNPPREVMSLCITSAKCFPAPHSPWCSKKNIGLPVRKLSLLNSVIGVNRAWHGLESSNSHREVLDARRTERPRAVPQKKVTLPGQRKPHSIAADKDDLAAELP